MSSKTPAFVLRTQDYRDTSLLATFYGRDCGKIKAIVKGGRNARLQYGSTLEPFSLNEILYYERRRTDLHLVTAVELIERFEPLRRDLERLGRAAYFLELVDQLTEAGDPNPEVFELLHEGLKFLCENGPAFAARLFEIKLMQAVGFMPELESCVRCGEESKGEACFSIPSGGILCAACRKGEGPVVFISGAALEFLSAARVRPFADLGKSVIPAESAEKIERLLRQFVDFHLGYKPKSLTFLEKVGA